MAIDNDQIHLVRLMTKKSKRFPSYLNKENVWVYMLPTIRSKQFGWIEYCLKKRKPDIAGSLIEILGSTTDDINVVSGDPTDT
jgi:hypothetical protein